MPTNSTYLNQDVVQSVLDALFYPRFETVPGPYMIDATDDMAFRQETVDHGSYIYEVFGGSGSWAPTPELTDFQDGTILIGDKVTQYPVKFAQQLPISREWFRDAMYGSIDNAMEQFATAARLTRDQQAFNLYNGGFTTSTTADGVAWFSNSHTNLNGDTVDNLVSGALSTTTLNDGMVSLASQLTQAGQIGGYAGYCLLVPPALFKTARELGGSELLANTANNNMNVFLTDYGIYVKQSNKLGAIAGGSDTAWFLLSKTHSGTRMVRESIATELVPPQYSQNDVYYYKGSYREMYFAKTYDGAVASTGL